MKILASYRTMIALLALYAISMAAATFLEKAYGTMLAKVAVYYSPLFFLLQFFLVVNFIMIAIRYHLLRLKRWGLLLVHFSFIVILTGALITHIFGQEGTLHLREGETGNVIAVQTNRGNSVITMPFQMELVRFTLTRYPGSMSPSSYESELLVHIDGKTRRERVYMNNVLDVKGYRFFQASYDADEAGTILSVSKDMAGRSVTYTGYVLLLIGCVACLVAKNGRLRTLIRVLAKQKTAQGCFPTNDILGTRTSRPHAKRKSGRDVRVPNTVMYACLMLSSDSRNDGNNKEARDRRRSSKLLLFAVLLLACSAWVSAQMTPKAMADAVQKMAIHPAHAERFSALSIQSTKGRIIPMNTFSSEILRKLHKNNRFGQLNSDRFLLSLLVLPEMWMRVPVINYSNNAIADYYSIPRNDCSYTDMFHADGSYKLQGKLDEAYRRTPSERTGFDKDIIKLDEKVNILYQLFEYQLIRLFPDKDDPTHTWASPGDDLEEISGLDSIFYSYLSEVQNAMRSGDWSKANEALDRIATYQTANNNVPGFNKEMITLELIYNKLEVFRWCKIGYLSLGGLMLLFLFSLFFSEKPWNRWILRFMIFGVILFFLFHLSGILMRWKIGGYAPWSNSYETMVFLAWTVVLGGLFFARRSPVTFSLATLFAGIILFVSGLNWMDPQINPLVPVLKSPWLMFHVAILMAAYGLFGICCLLGLVNLLMTAFISKEKLPAFAGSIRELTVINEIAMLVGLILMTIGTFMGAVWANESWGRYWGWDPKETWALITMVVYAMVTHLHLLRKWYNLWLFNLCSVISFASVLMTYFGVNYILSGMHSYGESDLVSGMMVYLCGATFLILLLASFARKKRKYLKNYEL